jgi:vesicle-fusing ATPase
MDYQGVNFNIQVLELSLIDADALKNQDILSPIEGQKKGNRGLLMHQTEILFKKAPDSKIKLAGAVSSMNHKIIQPTFKFEDLGIGGLDAEFSAIFRRAFASRIFPPSLVEKMGIQHVRGILLFGPPGTGKTLM